MMLYDCGSEADRLSEFQDENVDESNICDENGKRWARYTENSFKMAQYTYKKNQTSPIGSEIQCPICKRIFIKTTYHKSFCSNQKTTSRFSCKDRYWDGIRWFSLND